MGTSLFKPYKIRESQLDAIPIQEGQLFFTIDTNKIYLDESNEKRILFVSNNDFTDITEILLTNNLLATEPGTALDATQGKILKDLISNLDSKIVTNYATVKSVEDLKKSVSDGKTLVASAITNKGVTTAADAEFAIMAENIGQIKTISDIKLQERTVKSSKQQFDITPDTGYNGISKVTVNPVNLKDYEMKSFVTTNPKLSQVSSLDQQYDGISQVILSGALAQSKTVSPSTSVQTIKPDSGYDALNSVTVNAMKLQEKTASIQMTDGNLSGYAGLYPDSGYDGLFKVNLPIFKTQSKTVTPTTVQQTITPDSGKQALSSVVVNAAKLQNKSVTPTSSVQTIYPDSGFYGLGAVSVSAIDYSLLKVKQGSFIASSTTQTHHKIELGFKPYFIFFQVANFLNGFIVYSETVSTNVTYHINKANSGDNKLLSRSIGGSYSCIYEINSTGFVFNTISTAAGQVVYWMACTFQ